MKPSIVFSLVLVFTLALVGTASAVPSVPADATVDTTSPDATINGPNLTVASGVLASGCGATQVTFLKWSLVGLNSAAGPLTNLTLRMTGVFGASGNLELFQVANDNWLETTITSTFISNIGASIASVPMPTAVGPVVFSGANLASYVNQESAYVGGVDTNAGDDTISFALKITGCTAVSSVAAFDSKDKSGGVAPALNLFNPTAVTLSTFRAADPAVNWPLILAVGLLGLALVVSLIVYRKRAAVRA